jgi:DNA-binding NarL/FixJ family response regulator
MENNIYIIEDKFNILSQNLPFNSIEFTPDLITDAKIDHWVIHILFGLNPNIKKLIIPIRLGYEDTECIGLRIGLHIRLTKELKDNRYIPILFVSINENREEIISSQISSNILLTSLILFTPGSELIDLFDLNEKISNFPNRIDESILKRDVLPKLILPNQRGSGHQLSNEWGALRLAKLARINLRTLSKPTDLYFKYQFAYSDFDITATEMNKTGAITKNCKFLIIDDNAKNGWEELISHIIDSEVINKFTNKSICTSIIDFEQALKFDNFEIQDVIFLDLRLKKEEENLQNESINELSGVQVLKKIKSVNKGTQVIIITASNKAWNMKALLDAEADSYFIKESIDVTISEATSQKNYLDFINSIKNALNRTYLKEIFARIKILNLKLKNLLDTGDEKQDSFLNEIIVLLDQSYDMHYHAKDEKQFAYAYVTLYMIIEIINKEYAKEDEEKNWYIDGEKIMKWTKRDYTINFDDTDEKYRSEANKILGIAIQKLKIESTNKTLLTTNNCIKRRTIFIHPKATNKEGELMKADGKIYTKDGFTELFNLIELLLTKIN